ncbi:VOC family protein [Rummeliibacillus pycnus]|uniref:VOC family protein n=1 Tax=Rummeliibacillus pycnus TaxID=101070 RepID=UPI0037C59DAE
MKYHEKPNMYVKHVEIKVADLDRSIKYYTEIIGFQILQQTADRVTFTTDGQSSILSIIQPEGAYQSPQKTTGLYHFAILLPSRRELANIVKHLQQRGIYFGASDHDVSEALYLSDPDNNGIEIYADRVPEEWTWNGDQVFMKTEPLNFKDLMQSEQGEWNGLPVNTVMGHIHLHVGNLEKAKEFYSALGYQVVLKYGRQALFISTGDYHHHIGLNTWNGEGAPKPAEKQVGLQSFTVQLDERDEDIMKRLTTIGASVEIIENGFITVDPFGNRIIVGK